MAQDNSTIANHLFDPGKFTGTRYTTHFFGITEKDLEKNYIIRATSHAEAREVVPGEFIIMIFSTFSWLPEDITALTDTDLRKRSHLEINLPYDHKTFSRTQALLLLEEIENEWSAPAEANKDLTKIDTPVGQKFHYSQFFEQPTDAKAAHTNELV